MCFDASGAQIARAGGLDYFISDEGSGYEEGRPFNMPSRWQAARRTNAPLQSQHIKRARQRGLYASTPDASLMHKETPKNSLRASGAAPIVFEVAFSQPSDTTALKTLRDAATSLVRLLTQVVHPSSAAGPTRIASSGGLMKNSGFRIMLEQAVRNAGYLYVKKALAQGANIICAQGGESRGHTGDTPLFILIPTVVDLCKDAINPLTGEPVIIVAAGDIADGRGLPVSLAYGASGVWVGTRFMRAARGLRGVQ
ncbi:hypothetical protein EW146_g6455 [Bondarzewia mesenterica]|uniref:Uncharacterized protein n=1 Tax=Bondarzewia mesenterica TaxID=1095465 RepID=A0A4S4LNN6_9AGAM|nr:hypothetical protein EW146_g6455 [Bondarzewia mesenterica]